MSFWKNGFMSGQAKSRHIVVCVTNFYPHPGGLERYAEELFSRLSATGWKVTVVSYAEASSEEDYRGIHIIRIPFKRKIGGVVATPDMKAWKEVTGRLSQEGIDVISTQTRFFFSSWYGMKWAKQLKVPHVHTEHGSDFVQHKSPVIRWGSWFVDVTMGKKILRNAQVVTCVSQDVATFVQKLSGRPGVVIHNGVDIHFWDPATAKPVSPIVSDWIGKRQAILWMGRVMGAKGWKQLVDAVEMLPNKKELAVLFAGKGPEEKQLQKIAEAQSDQYSYLSAVDRPVIRDLLTKCAYVNPSYSAEGLQTTLLEAAAMNSWVITTDVSGTSEVITPEVGVVVPRRDTQALSQALAALLTDRPVASGRGYMESQFSWEHSLKQYQEVLNQVTASHV
jgi:glycosyltransferase involved in cell wall biosynthesis